MTGAIAIPASRRAKAFSMNTAGWDGQAKNLEKFFSDDDAGRGPRQAPHEA